MLTCAPKELLSGAVLADLRGGCAEEEMTGAGLFGGGCGGGGAVDEDRASGSGTFSACPRLVTSSFPEQ